MVPAERRERKSAIIYYMACYSIFTSIGAPKPCVSVQTVNTTLDHHKLHDDTEQKQKQLHLTGTRAVGT